MADDNRSRTPVRKRNRWKGFLLFLAVAGPGIITSNVDNDAGGIATYSMAGAHFGYQRSSGRSSRSWSPSSSSRR